ncbi:MAG: phage tail protein [Pseudomonadota bacterium]|nr:phage tail protein [Pseudomonadota bacterium]
MNPYKNSRFVGSWDGVPVLGVSKVSGLTRTPQGPLSPGQTGCAPLTLERGVTFDPAFERWANRAWFRPDIHAPLPSGQEGSDFRKDLRLDVYNDAGQKVMSYTIYRCWVSEFIALPELDSTFTAVAIQSITLENEGWQRDYSVTDPAEPAVKTTPPT